VSPHPVLILHLPSLQDPTIACANLLLKSTPSEIDFYLLAPKNILIECQALCRKPKRAVVVRPESGFVKAVQEIAEAHPGSDLIFAGADVAPQNEDWFPKIQSKALSSPNIAAIGVKTLSPKFDIYSFGRRIVSPLGIHENYANLWWNEENLGQTSNLEKMDSVAGTLCYVRRTSFDAVGGFDPQFCPWKYDPLMAPRWIEFDDLFLRMIVKEYSVQVEPSIAVVFTPVELNDEEKKLRLNVLTWTFDEWEKKWGWNPEYPEPHAIRQKWGETPLCRWIGKNLLDDWDSPQPPVDVVILTYNDLPNLKECLAHLEKTDYPNFTVWILNHGCVDETPEFLKTLPGRYPFPVKIVDAPVNVGIPAANNWMIKVTSAPVIAFLDSDAFIPPHWLRHLVETLRRHPYAGLVGVKVVERHDPKQITWSEKTLWTNDGKSSEEIDHGQRDYIARTLISTGCCQVYRRKVFSTVGVFDLNFGPIGLSDIEHHIATRAAGYDILYDGFVTVRHSFRKRLKKDMNLFNINQSKMAVKWGAAVSYVLDRAIDRFDRKETFPVE
jgi:GT2 family glycosyltransferase